MASMFWGRSHFYFRQTDLFSLLDYFSCLLIVHWYGVFTPSDFFVLVFSSSPSTQQHRREIPARRDDEPYMQRKIRNPPFILPPLLRMGGERNWMGIKQTVRGVSSFVCVHVNINCHQLGCYCIYQKEGSIAPTWKEEEEKEEKRSVCVILNISLRFLIFSLSLSPPFKIQKNIVFLLSFLRIYYYSFNPLIRVSGSWLFFFLGSLKFLHTHTLRIHTPIKKKGEKIK